MDYTDRVRKLAASVGLRVRRIDEPVPPERCWVDARVSCPYGSPEGQFINRPEAFCNERCPTFGLHLTRTLNEQMDERRPSIVRKYFKEKCTKVSDELAAHADSMSPDSTERLTLELAADVLRDRKLDRDILIEDDLSEE